MLHSHPFFRNFREVGLITRIVNVRYKPWVHTTSEGVLGGLINGGEGLVTELKKVFQKKLHRSVDQNTF